MLWENVMDRIISKIIGVSIAWKLEIFVRKVTNIFSSSQCVYWKPLIREPLLHRLTYYVVMKDWKYLPSYSPFTHNHSQKYLLLHLLVSYCNVHCLLIIIALHSFFLVLYFIDHFLLNCIKFSLTELQLKALYLAFNCRQARPTSSLEKESAVHSEVSTS